MSLYKIMDEDGNLFVNNFIIYNINMDYYTNLIKENDTNKINNDIILVMLGLERNDLKKLSKNNKVVSKYMKELDEVNEKPEFREYMSYEKDQELLRNTEREIGREEGIEQGIERGKQELKNQIIDSLLSKGMSQEEIHNLIDINPNEREYMSYEKGQELLRNTEREIGREEGIEQRNIEIVNNLLNTNMSITEIAKIVNLPEEKIIEIKDAKE